MDVFGSKADLLEAYVRPGSWNAAPTGYKKEYVVINTELSRFTTMNGEKSVFVAALDKPLKNVVKTDLIQYSINEAVGSSYIYCVESRALGNNMTTYLPERGAYGCWRIVNNVGQNNNPPSILTTLSRVDTYFEAPRDITEIDVRITNIANGVPGTLNAVLLVIEVIRVALEPAAQTLP